MYKFLYEASFFDGTDYKVQFAGIDSSGAYQMSAQVAVPGTAATFASEDAFRLAAANAMVTWANTVGAMTGITTANIMFVKPLSIKKVETFSGTTNASGVYSVTFGTAYSVAPNIQANIIGGTDNQIIRISSVTTTGFSVLVRNRTDVIGLLPTYSNVSGASVDVLITQK